MFYSCITRFKLNYDKSFISKTINIIYPIVEHTAATNDFVRFDKIYLRPSEISSNRGDPKLAASSLGWKSSIQVSELADLMVEHDVKLIKGQVQDIPRSDLWDFECRNP
jgi:GDP-D-mannose dehydratase